jgi:hypothetical protein
MTETVSTFPDLIPCRVFSDMRATVAAAMPHLKWRYNGLGVLQAYLVEGELDELRVHVWHPSLEKPGIRFSGKIHDHRFDLRSTVLLGAIGHVEYRLTPSPSGAWETHAVVNARKAMADESVYKAGLFDGQVESTAEYFHARMVPYTFRERDVYLYPKGCFHESHVSDLCVTLVRKMNQEERKARILAPRDHEVVHAFAEPKPESEWRPFIERAVAEMLAADHRKPVSRRPSGPPQVQVRENSRSEVAAATDPRGGRGSVDAG